MAKGFYGGRGGAPNMGNLQQAIKQAQKMQEDMQKAQAELQESTFEAQSGGGMVKAVVSGTRRLKALEINPEAVDPDDVEMLSDMIVAAVNSALALVDEKSEQQMSKITGGMNIPGMF